LPQTITAWVILHWMTTSLAVRGFERTLRVARTSRPAGRGVSRGVDALVQRTAESVERAKRWHVRKNTEDCLPVALASMYLLRRRGIEADLVLGVKRYPFDAHAWVVVGERVVDFPADKYKQFVGVNMTSGKATC
jgi:hypothetical protein